MWLVFGSTDRKRFLALCLLTLVLIAPAVLLLFGDEIVSSIARQTVLMGRQGNSPETLTGRIPLWNFLIANYLHERPLFGFGFQGFWSPEHIMIAFAKLAVFDPRFVPVREEAYA